jgi:hypothetical protein
VGSAPAYSGASYPSSQLTLSSSWSLFHHQLRVSALFDHRGGYKIANRTLSGRCIDAYCAAALDPKASLADQAANVAYSPAFNYSYWGFFENGAFTRLRELSITYQLPPSVVRAFRSRNASVTLSGRNLALWSGFRDTDPETQTQVGAPQYGAFTAEGGVPPAQYWILRLNLGL